MRRLFVRASVAFACCVALLVVTGCGESKLDKMKRLSGVGNPDDPEVEVPAEDLAKTATPGSPLAPPPPPATPQSPTAETSPPSAAVATLPSAPPAVPQAKATPAAASLPTVSTAAAQPRTPLTPEQCRERTIKNLEAIALAFESMAQNSGAMPEPAYTDETTGALLLSWRVALLPYLGHAKLYSQFKLTERWDSPHNRQLLAQIPPEYQSPERQDAKTNYLCPVGPQVAMSATHARRLSEFKDQPKNTIVLVEVDDARAVPWTQPVDLPVDLNTPLSNVGTLRGDGIFAIRGNFTCGLIPQNTSADTLQALWTFAGGDGPEAAKVMTPLTVQVASPVPIPAALASEASASQTGQAPASALPSAPASSRPSASSTITPGSVPAKQTPNFAAIRTALAPAAEFAPGSQPVPDESTLQSARELVRQVYATDYAQAATPAAKQRLAKQLLTAVAEVSKPAEQYEMIRVARDIAISLGDIPLAFEASDQLTTCFQLEPCQQQSRTLLELQPMASRTNQLDALLPHAQSLLARAWQSQRFEPAESALDVLVSCYRARQVKLASVQAAEWKAELSAAREAYVRIPACLTRLEQDPSDPEANEAVGKYLCLVRHEWDLGLPLLARGEDIQFKFVATIDLEPQKTTKMLVQLGDTYWQLAEVQPKEQRAAIQNRAVHFYDRALLQLEGSLDRIKIQKRVQEFTHSNSARQLSLLRSPQTPTRSEKE
jgi:hypothetical protein